MKTTITAVLALVLLASTATAALAQDQGGHRGGRHDGGGRAEGGHRDGGHRGGGQREGGERPQFRDSGRRDMGGQDNHGQRRSEFQADQRPTAPPRAREAPAAPAAVQAPQARSRAQFRGGDGGQSRANRDFGAYQRDGNRGGEGARDNNHRGDGVRGDGLRGDGARDGRRDNDRRDSDRARRGNGHDWDRGGGDRYRGGDNRDHRDHRDDRGRPHWQQGRYPPIYRSHQRYRYGYYRPPIGFYSHNWAFGEFLPRGWYGSDYLLDSWWDYDLPYPPPGYDWVRVGDDALLIDRYTGEVVQVVRDIFW